MIRRDLLQWALRLSASGLILPPLLRRGALAAAIGSPGRAKRLSETLAGRILVLVHQNGGNDGLNTVVPITDPLYYAARPNLAIPPEEAVVIETDTGLHPSLAPLADLYAAGKMAVLQGVGYPDMNLSHFRSTDIWLSGSSSDTVVETGWIARYLEKIFGSFPLLLPEAPFALQQSFAHRIPLNGERGITGVVVDNPDTFYNLVNANYTGPWNDDPPATRGGEELTYVRQIDVESFEYAEAIQQAADAGTNTVPYPSSTLGLQLEIAARLISGQLDTPIYLTAEYGFDTHAAQAGRHATILGSVGGSIAAFLTDLANQGLDEKVLVLTTSEFGRRVHENVSLGTDHGTAAPLLALGQPVLGGIYGTGPDLANLDQNGNLLIQNDFRSVYAEILMSHFGLSSASTDEVLFDHFDGIGFLNPVTSIDETVPIADRLYPPSPNPVSISATGRVDLRFDLAQSSPIELTAFDIQGRRVATLGQGEWEAGRHRIGWDLGVLPAGIYLIRLVSGRREQQVKLTIVP